MPRHQWKRHNQWRQDVTEVASVTPRGENGGENENLTDKEGG